MKGMNKMNGVISRMSEAYYGIIDSVISLCELMNKHIYEHSQHVKDPFWSTSDIHRTIVVCDWEEVVYS